MPLTLSPQPARGAITLTATGLTGTLTSIVRWGSNDIAGSVVRRPPGLAVSGGGFTFTDYDVPPGHDRYRYYVTTSGSNVWADVDMVRGPSIGPVQNPAQTIAIDLVTDFRATRTTAATVHQVIDRTDALVTLNAGRLVQGSVDLWVASYTAALALEAVLNTRDVLALRGDNSTPLQRWLVPQRVELAPQNQQTTPRRWSVRVDFVEVAGASIQRAA